MPELAGPDLPEEMGFLWAWFVELSGARGSGGLGPAPLTYPDIAAWSALTGVQPRPWQVALLKRLDFLFLASMRRATHV
ncbi:MAG: hypothetical protein RIB84_21210 [Sneathiellaceae bacterium]